MEIESIAANNDDQLLDSITDFVFLGTRVVEIGTRLQFSTRRKCLFDDKERSSRRPSLSPLFTSSKQYSILLPTNERNIAREKVREKEERGNYYYYYCYLEKLPGNSTRVKGKKGEFFLFYKILVNNCGAIARGAKKKKRPLTIHDNRFLSATARAVQPLPSPFNGKGTPSTVTSTLVTALVTGRIGRHQRLKESI